MRKVVAIGMILVMVAVVLSTVPMKARAADTNKITPEKGKVGHTAVIHGSGFRGTNLGVVFGSKPAVDIEVPNNKTIKVTVPNRNAIDPNPVRVTVTVDGEPAIGDLWFTYDPIGPEPVITGFNPREVEVGTPVKVTIYGTDFTTQQGRMPDQIFLVGPELIEGTVIVDATATSFAAEFRAATLRGVYLIIVGFSDGSGASADGFNVI